MKKMIGNGFVTNLPIGWEDRSTITLVGPTGRTGFLNNVVITRESVPPDTRVADYARVQLKATPIAGLRVLDESTTSLNDAPVYQRLQRFEVENHRVQQQQTFVLGAGIIFVVTCTATVEEFDQQFPAFEQVLKPFRLFDPESAVL